MYQMKKVSYIVFDFNNNYDFDKIEYDAISKTVYIWEKDRLDSGFKKLKISISEDNLSEFIEVLKKIESEINKNV